MADQDPSSAASQHKQDDDKATTETPAAGKGVDWEAEAKKLRGEAAKYRTAARDAEAKVKQFEDAGKSETERLTSEAAGHKARADKAELDLLRLNVGLGKGLTAAQSKRLVGTTQEEFEADADELIATFKPTTGDGDGADNGKPAPTRRPAQNTRGGGEPDKDPEPDTKTILAKVPRL